MSRGIERGVVSGVDRNSVHGASRVVREAETAPAVATSFFSLPGSHVANERLLRVDVCLKIVNERNWEGREKRKVRRMVFQLHRWRFVPSRRLVRVV